MAGALRGARSCGRCGAELPAVGRFCPRCGVPRIPAASGSALGTYSGLLAGVQISTPGRRRLARLVDAVLLLVPLASLVAVLVAAADEELRIAGAVSLAAVVVAVLVSQAFALTTRGRTLGLTLLRLRSVDDLTGEPPRAAQLLAAGSASRRHLATADLGRGRDPLSSALPRVAAGALALGSSTSGRTVSAEAGPGEADRPREASPTVVLHLDSGDRVELEHSLLVGRLPVNPEGSQHPVFAWPDLSRSLSKTHALFEWTGSVLWVTDLGSTNGSSLVAPDGTRQPLAAGLRGPAAPGWTVQLGERTLSVVPSGVLA